MQARLGASGRPRNDAPGSDPARRHGVLVLARARAGSEEANMDKKRVLIVEDVRLFSDLLARTLSSYLDIIGMARDGATAITLAAEHQPDAVLMDIELEGAMDGIEAAIKIKQAKPSTGIVILSSHNDRRYVTSLPLVEIPGWAYLLKQTAPDIETVLRAIDASMNGMVMLDPSVVEGLKPRKDSLLASLTPRQLEVLQLIAEGHNNSSIAEHLVIAEKSVETYINSIYQNLNVSGEPGVHARVRAAMIFIDESQNA
jgi:DNA-binding NarL/FixJ family response regulator